MKNLTISEAKARYGKTKNEINDALREYQDKLPPGADTFSLMCLNGRLIEFLDEIFDYHADETEDAPAVNQLSDSEKEALIKQINELKIRLQESEQVGRKEIEHLRHEKRELENSFIEIKKGTDSYSTAIKKLQAENELLLKKLDNFNQLKLEELKLKDNRIAELEQLNSELDEMLQVSNREAEDKMKVKLRYMDLANKQSGLNEKIAQAAKDKTALEKVITELKNEIVHHENDSLELKEVVTTMMETIINTVAQARLKIDKVNDTVTALPIEPAKHVIEVQEDMVEEAAKTAPVKEVSYIRQDDEEDNTKGADAMPPSQPSSF